MLSALFDYSEGDIPKIQFFLTKNGETIMVSNILNEPKRIIFRIKRESDKNFSKIDSSSQLYHNVRDIVDNFLLERISYISTNQSTNSFGLPLHYFTFYETMLSSFYNIKLCDCKMTFRALDGKCFNKGTKNCRYGNLEELKGHFGVSTKNEGFLIFAILFDGHTSIMTLDLKENKFYLFDSSGYHKQKLSSLFPNSLVNEVIHVNEKPLQKHPYGTCFYIGQDINEEILQIDNEDILRTKLKCRNTRAELSLKTAKRTSNFIDKYFNNGTLDQEKPEIIITNPQEQGNYSLEDYEIINERPRNSDELIILLRKDQLQKTCIERSFIPNLVYAMDEQYHMADNYSLIPQPRRRLIDQRSDSEITLSIEEENTTNKCKCCC